MYSDSKLFISCIKMHYDNKINDGRGLLYMKSVVFMCNELYVYLYLLIILLHRYSEGYTSFLPSTFII